jgi:short-subunit dehydrogenase
MSTQAFTALLTGASGGIGAAIAAAVLRSGGRVIATGRDKQALHTLQATLDPTGQSMLCVPADVTEDDDRQRLADVARTWRGGIDVLINNAGAAEFGLFAEERPADIEHVFAVNALAPMQLCRTLLPHLQRRPTAHIVNIGSVFGSIAYAGHATYSASKFALRGFSEALRRELADTAVRVHYLAPRATRTSFNTAAVDELNRRLDVACDSPDRVADAVMEMLRKNQAEAVIGWPEKFFARLNSVWPRVVDRALAKQLSTIRQLAGKPAHTVHIHSISRRAS